MRADVRRHSIGHFVEANDRPHIEGGSIRGDVMREGEVEPQSMAPKVRFIRDIPADDDFFSTHTRLAGAIVRAIDENKEIKVIGLLGRWGSGKSTVVNKVVELLEDRKDSGFRVFMYDAWLHQSDPLRRSFLESLIGALVKTEPSAIAKGKWSRELKRLSNPIEDSSTIETPTLTLDGWLLGASLLAVPVGVGLINFETLQEGLGKTSTPLGSGILAVASALILMPVITWLSLYLWRRPWHKFFSRQEGVFTSSFRALRAANGEPMRILQIFEEGQAKHTTTRTFRSTEPTSLEFGRMFQEIMREAADGGHRLVILIDNLDRVAEEEALGMWATIRSFFLASHETEDVTYESFHPTVILPIDRHAVETLFGASEDKGGRKEARDRARSFMDKTFDVTFEVTEPVHSDWRDFLDHQMRWMFNSDYQARWGFWTRRLFESELVRQQAEAESEDGRPLAIVTPREINKLLNRIGALYLQWGETKIPVEVMALYVIRRDDIDRGLLAFLQSEVAEIAEIAPDWKRQLAALHYGVDVDKAAQVLLAEPIRTAISRGDEAGLKALASIPGFGERFEYATDNLPEPAGTGTPFSVLVNAALLLRTIEVADAEWSGKSWRNLLARYSLVTDGVTPAAGSLEIVSLLSPHVAIHDREAFIQRSAALIARGLGQPRRQGDGSAQAALALVRFAEAGQIALPLFELEVEPPIFLARLNEFAGQPAIWPQLRTSHDGEALEAALVEMLSAQTVQRNVPNAVLRLAGEEGPELYAGDTLIDFEAVAAKADEIARDPANNGGDAMAGIRTLARLTYGRDEGRDLLVALVDEGILATRLNEMVSRSDWDAAADLIAILLWRGRKFSAPSDLSWSQYPVRDPDHLRRIVSALSRYFPNQLVQILWTARRANILYSNFFESIIGQAVATDSLGSFDPKPVLADLLGHKLAVPYKQRDKFLEQLDRRSNLLSAIENRPLGAHAMEAAKYLRRKGGEHAQRADTALRTGVEQADAATWVSALKTGAEPYGLGLAFIKSGDLKLGSRSGLRDALHTAVGIMVKDAGREVRGRWFKLCLLLKPKDGKVLQKELGEALETASPTQALHVLKAGGVEFLKVGGFASRPNQSVRKIIIPQLGRKDGRDWLRDNRDEMTAWVQKSDAKARAELLKSLNAGLRSTQEDRRYTANLLAAKWGLNTSD